MSILIKNMDMPSDDKPVTLVITNGRADELVPDIFGARYTTMYRVTEVTTPHGRLIDADALLKKTADTVEITAVTGTEEDKEFCEKFWRGFSLFVNKAPTIIEAED